MKMKSKTKITDKQVTDVINKNDTTGNVSEQTGYSKKTVENKVKKGKLILGFIPDKGAIPHIGEAGKAESVEEERIEITLDSSVVESVISAMEKSHPYEEVAYDLYPLEVLE